MLKQIRYEGPLITDVDVDGEGKGDGIIPAHASGAMPLSRDRWIIFVSTLDTRGWDAVRSIVYQLREGGPAGLVLREGLLIEAERGWRPEPGGPTFRKVFGMPMAFGVPKGARRSGRSMPNENVFAVKCYRRVIEERDGRIVARDHSPDSLRSQAELTRRYQRVEWLQFRLNDAEDDIEIIQPRRTLMQLGYDDESEFCELGPGHYMNHAMTPPVAADPSCLTWYECDTFAFDEVSGRHGHGQIAPVEYTWNAQTGLYEWTRVGSLHIIPGRAIGEASISRWDEDWVVAARSNCIDGSTAWYRTADLFAGLGEPTLRDGTWGPRHSYRCADGALRIFLNDQSRSPYGQKRNPLYMIRVDPVTFDYGDPVVVLDAEQADLGLVNPFLDMAKLCPGEGDHQRLVFRTISASMTTGPASGAPPPTEAEMAVAGIHCAALVYDEPSDSQWAF